MAGTKAGGKRAAAKNKANYGDDFYKQIGSLGGRVKTSKPKGFAANPELASRAGRKGGKKSSRAGVENGQGKQKEYINTDGKFAKKPSREFNFKNAVEALPDEYVYPKRSKAQEKVAKSFWKKLFGGK